MTNEKASKVNENQASAPESLWQDPSRINHYFTDFLIFEQTFIMWFLSIAPFWKLNQDYLEVSVRRLPSLLNDICSVIESLAKDINYYLGRQFNPAFYINQQQINGADFRVQNFHYLANNYLKIKKRYNIPAPNNFNSDSRRNVRIPKVNNIGISDPTSDARLITRQQQQLKETRMHYDFDYLAHIDFRLGTSSKKVQLRTDVLPIDLEKYSWILYPLKNAHLPESNLDKAKGESRPKWCTVYQGTKHALADRYQDCNGLVVLQALGALYILCILAKYLPETKIPEYPNAPEIGSFPLEDLSQGSLLFKPTITRTTFIDFSNELSNQNLVERKDLPEAMFIIKDSDWYFDIMLNNQFLNNQQLADQLKEQHGIVDLLSKLPLSVFKKSGLQPKVVLNTYCHYEIIKNQTNNKRNNKKVEPYSKQMMIGNIYNYQHLNKLRSRQKPIKK